MRQYKALWMELWQHWQLVSRIRGRKLKPRASSLAVLIHLFFKLKRGEKKMKAALGTKLEHIQSQCFCRSNILQAQYAISSLRVAASKMASSDPIPGTHALVDSFPFTRVGLCDCWKTRVIVTSEIKL